jgi:hypothetical protein
MATYTASGAQQGVTPKGLRVGLVSVTAFYSFPTSLSVGAVIQMIKVPANAQPVLIKVASTATGQGTVQVGDGISPARYYAETTLSAGMGWVVCENNITAVAPYTYSTDDTIDITISRVSISTLGGAVYLTAIFSMDPAGSGAVTP